MNKKEYMKKHYRENKDKYLKQDKEYYLKNKKQILQKNKEWKKRNPDKMNKTKFWINILTIVSFLFLIYGIAFAKGLTIDETKKQLGRDPYKIAQWIARNVKATSDSIGFAQEPERTFKYKKGDCEDLAILSRYFIGDRYKTHLVIWGATFREDSSYYKQMKGRKIAHCVVAIKLAEDNWGIIDQDRFIQYGKTLAEIVKINCDLRRVTPIEAYIADLKQLRHKVIKYIDLEE